MALAHDFCILSETHCLKGRADALRLPPCLTALWSDGTASTAGIGIILHHNFLRNFLPVDTGRDWEEVIPGRVAILHLRGSQGALDIACVYFPTGDSYAAHERRNAIVKLGRRIADHSRVLTCIAGDFNFVEHERDRWCLEQGAWTGGKDTLESEAFEESIRKPHSMHEWEQGHFTCEAGGARSRIDRFYCNQHLSLQLDRSCSCSALEWDKATSVHRPISFARRSASHTNKSSTQITQADVSRPGWADEVEKHFLHLCQIDGGAHNAIRRLVLFKDAIRDVTDNHRGETPSTGEAISPDDKLGYTMSCLRHIERHNEQGMQKCARAYPKLRDWIYEGTNFTIAATNIIQLRNHAIELAREQIQEQIQSLNSAEATVEDRSRTKDSILQRLKRLSPGESTSLDALQDAAGKIHTSPLEIAKMLRQHWEGVFKHKEVDSLALQIWMEELFIKDHRGCFITGLPEQSSRVWHISRKAVASAISSARNTMPGPDGIPAAAYRNIKHLSTNIFLDAARALGTGNNRELMLEAYSDRSPEGLHEFNLSLLCCLPKKPHGAMPEGGFFYREEDTRPLSLVNVDNRIIANAARIVWEPILANYISKMQQGFLKGRKLLNNVLDINYNAMTVSLKCAKGALIFFDFKAAFPSISHGFLKDSLRHLGLPEHALAFIDGLYSDNNCHLAYKGSIYEGFGMHCGVRQGCPLSPLLFAASVDILLRIIQKRIPSSILRAFADDIGAVIEDWDHDSRILEQAFSEFALMSGLDLNISKTVVVPLWEEGLTEIGSELRNSERTWKHMCVAGDAVYLGFSEGPGKGAKSWDKPISKFSKRCKEWGTLGEGLQYSTVAFNTFAASVLSYISQLETPPPSVHTAECFGIRRMVPGPGGWCNATDMHFLRECYGQSKSFQLTSTTAAAAKLRVLFSHDMDVRHTGNNHRLTIAQYHYRLTTSINNTPYLSRYFQWRAWYDHSHVAVLMRNKRSLEAEGVVLEQLLAQIAGGPRPWPHKVRMKQLNQLQKAASLAIKKHRVPNGAARIREKIDRWLDPDAPGPRDISLIYKLAGPPAHIANRIHSRLQLLPSLVPPRVCAATLRLIFNGWCTQRRYQRRHSAQNVCVLGCGAGAEDSVEHYCRCPAVQHTLRAKLRKTVPDMHALSFWCLDGCATGNTDDLYCSSIICYATYKATNYYRRRGKTTREIAIDALGQHIIQAVAGHPGATAFLNSRWISGRSLVV